LTLVEKDFLGVYFAVWGLKSCLLGDKTLFAIKFDDNCVLLFLEKENVRELVICPLGDRAEFAL